MTAFPETRSSRILALLSNEVSFVFQVPYLQLSDFLTGIKYIPEKHEEGSSDTPNTFMMQRQNRWGGGTFLQESWQSFRDAIMHADSVELVIILLGYIAMTLTLLSLFSAMRRLGSCFWLSAFVLLSGAISLLFDLGVVVGSGASISSVPLFEGIPFLVLTVGFEKSIRFTRAVLQAACEKHDLKRSKVSSALGRHHSLPHTMRAAVYSEGWPIVWHYSIEIGVLVAGAAMRPQDGFGSFCFLAACTLFFDFILLFTFYATALCVKLEVTNTQHHFKQHPDRSVKGEDEATFECEVLGAPRILGLSVGSLKVLMVVAVVLVNLAQLSSPCCRVMGGFLAHMRAPVYFNPFIVERIGLDAIGAKARAEGISTQVAVLSPIRYIVQRPESERRSLLGARAAKGVLAALEIPMIRIWLIFALIVSLVTNNHLIKVARLHGSKLDQTATKVPDVSPASAKPRSESPKRCVSLTNSPPVNASETSPDESASFSDEELVELCLRGEIAGYSLERTLEHQFYMDRRDACTRAVKIRRAAVSRTPSTMDFSAGLEDSKLPFQDYNYELVYGACCENVIGYLPIPLGLAGPLLIDGQMYYIPMATTEGVLVASASRGCKAINAGGGTTTVLNGDGMTRGPCVGFPSAYRASEAKHWIESEGRKLLSDAFNSTSRFARLQSLKVAQAGTYLFIRFKTTTGDAMGMNMISKGVDEAMKVMTESGFQDMNTITLSGNFCADKKSAAINWIDGRGKSIIAEASIPADTVRSVLKTDVDTLVELNTAKNLVGSAMAGSVGGFNAHASNLVTAVFLATGQDPAQNVESSNCITTMKRYGAPCGYRIPSADNPPISVGGNLHISVSMPSVEVGTIGGGTILEAQSAMLDLLGGPRCQSCRPRGKCTTVGQNCGCCGAGRGVEYLCCLGSWPSGPCTYGTQSQQCFGEKMTRKWSSLKECEQSSKILFFRLKI